MDPRSVGVLGRVKIAATGKPEIGVVALLWGANTDPEGLLH